MKSFTESNGFTLLEVLIALVILALALLSSAGLIETTKNKSFGGYTTEASTFAQDKLEEFRSVS